MTYCEAIHNLKQAKSVPYRKATFIKINKLLDKLEQEPVTKNDAVDTISREQALQELKESAEHHANNSREEVLLRRDRDIIRALPPVTPQEPRKGHWIYDYTSADGHRTYHCSECGCYLQPKHSEPLNSFKWCSLCGADMREVKE